MDTTQLDPRRPAPRSSSDPLHELRSLGDYRILRRLGEGGMGAVYLGYHEGQSQQVAIKVLADHLASSQPFVDRFYREAKAGALLNHPNIVRTLTVGQDRATGLHYLVLEFVDGTTAHRLLEEHGRLAVGDAVHIALDIARALEHAHSRNVIHRDIKPDNILITKSGVAKLADLGLAKRTDEASHLTAARQGFGTTAYMPYEQAISARAADGRSDIYALGGTLYHLLTGTVPFPGDNHLDVVEKKQAGAYTPAGELVEGLPPVLDAILARMLACDPRQRYQTASELIVDLERSRLAGGVPSFADPELARQDAWLQACLASSAEPTRAALETPPAPPAPPPAPPADLWHLRYRNREGRWCRAQATTRQVVQALRNGRLPREAQAARAAAAAYRPVAELEEFRAALPARPRKGKKAPGRNGQAAPKPGKNGRAEPADGEADSGSSRARWLVLIGAGAGLALLLALVVVYKLFLSGA
ncbi:MAG TPA: serine/threonine-protein kinase [Gemmataceae bacterium]|nr:serine/threonine-protein kinase [Gemmataceae bacterium]